MTAHKRVLLLGPDRAAVSGVSTHLNQLFSSSLVRQVDLLHFQVGSEGRDEGLLGKLVRFLLSPFCFALRIFVTQPHIVHINTSLEQKSFWRDVAYLIVAKVMRRKVVYQVHGGALPAEMFPRNRLLTWFLGHVLKVPDVIVLLAQVELLAYREFVPECRMVVIANAIDLDGLRKTNRQNRTGDLRLAYVGRLAEDKGIFEIVSALRLFLDSGQRATLAIAGTGPDEMRLKTAVSQAELGDEVTFLGAIFGKEKMRLWQDTDVFVFPTFHREGLPYALLESMAAGAVPITTRTGGMPDVMEDGVHGFFISPKAPDDLARALSRLNQDRSSLGGMSLAGHERVCRQYSVERLAKDFLDLYSSL